MEIAVDGAIRFRLALQFTEGRWASRACSYVLENILPSAYPRANGGIIRFGVMLGFFSKLKNLNVDIPCGAFSFSA
jgi:hypothetical protein